MKTIKLDMGVRSYRLGEGVLRFNPGDPNVYARFSQAVEKLQALEQDMAAKLAAPDAPVLGILQETDKAIKDTLNWVFGPENDFDAMLAGVNLLAATSDGGRLVQKLFAALEPVLLEGARECAAGKAAALKAQ